MKKKMISTIVVIILLFVVVIGVVGLGISKGTRKVTNDKDIERISKFAGTTAEVLLGEEKNMCYSPVSLYMSMCSIAELTNIETSNMILGALGYTTLDEMEKSYNKLVQKSLVTEAVGEKVVIANSVWMKNFNMTEEEKQQIESINNRFNVELFQKDYTDEDVNEWISKKTDGLINISHSKSDNSKIRLADTVYFESFWKNEFTENKKEIFRLNSEETVQVMYMLAEKENMNAIVDEEYTAVQKKYDSDSSMIFVKAEEGSIGKLVTAEIITQILDSFYNKNTENREVKLTVPKFETNSDLEKDSIEKALEKTGISGVLKKESWDKFPSLEADVIYAEQNVCMSVYEKGTKGAAVTTIDWVDYGKDDVLDIVLNEPFMYIIEKNGIPLFIGTVYNPTEG
ncbi:MAG: serpin family protein [Lachnospiraceae bacterium]|nr:serpin family protein [Lachnospiraceae bacterium]